MSTHKHKDRGDGELSREIPTVAGETRANPADDGLSVAPAHPPADEGIPSSGRTEKKDAGCGESLLDAAAELAAARAENQAVREELAVANDKYLRKLADEVNFRKRMVRDKDDARRLSIMGFLADVVPVLDDMDRALSQPRDINGDHLREGVVMIRRQFGQMLENKYGLKQMQSAGSAFDPSFHEAVNMEFGETAEPVVCEEYLPGYIVEERVVRTAKVKVRMPAPAPVAEPQAQSAEKAPDDTSTETSSDGSTRSGD